MKKIVCLLVIFASLAACHHKDDNEPKTENELAQRTVLIYMAAENDLTRYASYYFADEDLAQIKTGVKNIGSNNNLVVYVDKAETGTTPYTLYFHNGELVDSVAEATDSKTSDAAVLEKVISQSFAAMPAETYGLVLWGHASGWMIEKDSVVYTPTPRRRAYGRDTGDNSVSDSKGTWMNIPSMASAIATAMSGVEQGRQKLEFVFADCCNFQCLESAYELRHVTDYMIGSPAEIPGEGAPYHTLVPAMFEQGTFYTAIVDRYYEQRSGGYDVPLSVVKCSEMDNLASATSDALKSIDTSSRYPNLNGIIYYYYDWTNDLFFDANDFMLNHASSNAYAAWKQAFDKAVVYKKMATSWMTNKGWSFYKSFEVTEEKFGGVSMFVPLYGMDSSYNKDIRKMGWYYAAGYSEIGW